MIIGYARTSTTDQKAGLEAQRRDLTQAGCGKMFEEEVSSVDVKGREKLSEALEFLREGDTLVVLTTGFHPQQNLRAAIKHQLYMTQDSIVEERFTRVDEHEILYQFTVTDDSIYRRPWRGELSLRSTEGPIYEYACHEGNYAMKNILAGARQEEQE